ASCRTAGPRRRRTAAPSLSRVTDGRSRPLLGSQVGGCRIALAFAVVIVSGQRSRAQDAAVDTPWSVGVSPEQQTEALRLLDAGNALFGQHLYAQALASYRQAVATWDHPRIRFNMAVALIELDQPLAAYKEIEGSLRFGAAPFEAGFHEQALTYRKLLLGQLAQLRVICREPDAQVVLDGESWFAGPRGLTRVLTAGRDQPRA